MQISIFFCYSFVSPQSKILKVEDNNGSPFLLEDSATTVESVINDGWRLSHAIKTSQSAQLESFNFLLIFEK